MFDRAFVAPSRAASVSKKEEKTPKQSLESKHEKRNREKHQPSRNQSMKSPPNTRPTTVKPQKHVEVSVRTLSQRTNRL